MTKAKIRKIKSESNEAEEVKNEDELHARNVFEEEVLNAIETEDEGGEKGRPENRVAELLNSINPYDYTDAVLVTVDEYGKANVHPTISQFPFIYWLLGKGEWELGLMEHNTVDARVNMAAEEESK